MHMNQFYSTLILIAGLCLYFPTIGHTQSTVEVSGQVKDFDSKENLPYSKVIALDANDSIVRGGITDDKGFFNLPLEPGFYKIVTSAYGYTNDTLAIGAVQEDAFVGIIRMKTTVVDLEVMKVEASSRIDLLERDVQVITDEQKLSSTAAKDVLNKLPGISYDEYSGRLKVDNDANILVLVNGVEKNQEYVQNLEPERLLRVETVRDPGGRYGLEGYSAIVNIILKDDYKGTEVYLEEMQLVDINTRKSKLDLLIVSLGATYNYTHNKLNLYGAANLSRRGFKIESSTETTYDDGLRVLDKSTNDQNGLIAEYDAYYTLGFDYKFNPKHQLSFESHTAALPRSSNDNTFTYTTEIYSNDSLIDSFGFVDHYKSKSSDYNNSLFYIAEFDKRNKLNINFTYSFYEEDYTRNTIQEGVYDRVETGMNRVQFTRFYAEYDHSFSTKTTLQVGYGNTWREMKNNFDVNQTLTGTGELQAFSSDFKLNDLRHKLYTNFSWKMSKKWGLMVGLAGETSSPRSAGTQLHYFIFQPLFDLKYAASKFIDFRLKYRVSNAYPTIDEVNPFTSQLNPRMTSTGNPFLTPSTTHEFSLRINLLGGAISLEPYSHYSNNIVAQVGELDASNIFNYRYENVELYQRNGVELNFSKFFNISVLVQGNFDLFQSKIVSTSGTNSFMDWQADADLIYIFQKTETLLGLKYQRQQSKNITGLGYNKGDVDFWMLFYKQPLFKKRASILFGYFLPINIGAGYNQDSRTTAPGFTLQANNDVSLVKNMFILEFSYRFNKGNSVKKVEKTIQDEPEKQGGGLF